MDVQTRSCRSNTMLCGLWGLDHIPTEMTDQGFFFVGQYYGGVSRASYPKS